MSTAIRMDHVHPHPYPCPVCHQTVVEFTGDPSLEDVVWNLPVEEPYPVRSRRGTKQARVMLYQHTCPTPQAD